MAAHVTSGSNCSYNPLHGDGDIMNAVGANGSLCGRKRRASSSSSSSPSLSPLRLSLVTSHRSKSVSPITIPSSTKRAKRADRSARTDIVDNKMTSNTHTQHLPSLSSTASVTSSFLPLTLPPVSSLPSLSSTWPPIRRTTKGTEWKGKGRKGGERKLPFVQTLPIRKWIIENWNQQAPSAVNRGPIPSAAEAQQLSDVSGAPREQVIRFLRNFRQRDFKKGINAYITMMNNNGKKIPAKQNEETITRESDRSIDNKDGMMISMSTNPAVSVSNWRSGDHNGLISDMDLSSTRSVLSFEPTTSTTTAVLCYQLIDGSRSRLPILSSSPDKKDVYHKNEHSTEVSMVRSLSLDDREVPIVGILPSLPSLIDDIISVSATTYNLADVTTNDCNITNIITCDSPTAVIDVAYDVFEDCFMDSLHNYCMLPSL